MVFRFIAALFFIAAGGMSGIYKSEKLKTGARLCYEIGELLRQSAIMIRYRALNVYEISNELKTMQCCKKLAFVEKLPSAYVQGEDFHKIWCDLVNGDDLPDDEKKLLCDFGNILGTSDIDGQLRSIEAMEASLKLLEEKRSNEYALKGKLYRSIGLLFGVMIGIIVI